MKADLEKNVPMGYLAPFDSSFSSYISERISSLFFNAICFVPSNFQDPHALQLEKHPDWGHLYLLPSHFQAGPDTQVELGWHSPSMNSQLVVFLLVNLINGKKQSWMQALCWYKRLWGGGIAVSISW